MEGLGLILLLAVTVFLFWGLFWSIGQKSKRKQINKDIVEKLGSSTSGAYTFKAVQRYLEFGDLGGWHIGFVRIDETKKVISLFAGKFPDLDDVDLSEISADQIAFENLEEVEVVSDGNVLTKTNRGSQAAGAAIGAALLGPAGLLVGGLSGSTTAKEKIETVKVRLRVSGTSNPLYDVVVFQSPIKGGMKPDSFIAKTAIEPVDELVARLKNAMTSTAPIKDSSMQTDSSTKLSIGDQLEQLHKLLQTGAVTQDEYNALKAETISKATR